MARRAREVVAGRVTKPHTIVKPSTYVCFQCDLVLHTIHVRYGISVRRCSQGASDGPGVNVREWVGVGVVWCVFFTTAANDGSVGDASCGAWTSEATDVDAGSTLGRADATVDVEEELSVGGGAGDVGGTSILDEVREELRLAGVTLGDDGES